MQENMFASCDRPAIDPPLRSYGAHTITNSHVTLEISDRSIMHMYLKNISRHVRLMLRSHQKRRDLLHRLKRESLLA